MEEDKEIEEIFSRRLKDAMTMKKMTRKELSSQTGLSLYLIDKLRQGRLPDSTTLIKLSITFDLPLDYFFTEYRCKIEWNKEGWN